MQKVRRKGPLDLFMQLLDGGTFAKRSAGQIRGMAGDSWAVPELLGWGIWGTCLVEPRCVVWSWAVASCREMCTWYSTHVGVRGQLVDLSAPLLLFCLQDGTQISSLVVSWAILPAPDLKTFQFIRMIWRLDKMQNLRLLLKVCLARPLIPLLQLLEPHIRTLDLEQAEQIEKEAETGVDLMPGNLGSFRTGSAKLCMLDPFLSLALPAVGAPDPPWQFYPGLCSTSCSSVTHSGACLSLSSVQSLLPNWWWQELPPSCGHLLFLLFGTQSVVLKSNYVST